MLRYFLIFLFLLVNIPAFANFDFNYNCIKAYNHILSLRLNAARNLIAAEKKTNPQNSIPYLLDNYIDYFTILTTESKSDFERLKNNKALRLSRLERDDKNSPYYLFAQAEINLQWALTRGRFQEYITSAIEINKAYNLLQDNSKKFPSFLPNQKNLGMINALLGSLPDGLKRTMATFGIRGNTATGVRMLENLALSLPKSGYSHFYDEVVFYLSFVQVDIINDPRAYPSIMRNTQQIDSSSLLRTYIRGYAGMKTAHNDEAVVALANRPSGDEYQPWPYLDYLSGIAKAHRLDDNAANHFKTYLRTYKGINYIKDAYLNLAWLSLLKGDNEGYRDYIAFVKTKGYSYHEKDKQALSEAKDAVPDVELLKARLLFDGGYYAKALDAIRGKKVGNFENQRDKIEYCYRLGRIYDETGRDETAIKFYQFAINLGRNERYYFAANSALRIGNIYEKEKNPARARSFYDAAINFKDHDYEDSIENKAKEGLKRNR